jgi:hypothetical protein
MSVKKVFIRAASAYAAASLLTIPVKGITAKHEVRCLKIVLEGTIRSSAAGGFNLDARDYLSIVGSGSNAGGVFKKIRLTYNEKTDAINLTPPRRACWRSTRTVAIRSRSISASRPPSR